jgi:murein DD-endopeptidase MepM/ murein hydrolase activator NlpD
MRIRFWNVVLVPEEDGAIRSLRVSARHLAAGLGIAAFGLLLMVGSIGLHVFSFRGLQSLKRLRQENAALRDHLASVNQTLDQVEGMIRDGERMEKEARVLAGLTPANALPPGVGGPLVMTSGGSKGAGGDVIETLRDQTERIDALSRQADSQRQRAEQTVGQLRTITDRLAHTPSTYPLRGPIAISAPFGWRNDPFTGQRAFHNGLDLQAEPGSPVYATAAGTVESAGYDGEFGLCIRITHGYGYETTYCHLSSATVHAGQSVQRGDILGAVGSSGRSTGPHLHYEIHLNGAPRDPSAQIATPGRMVD